MSYKILLYQGVCLEVQDWIAPLWPMDRPLDKWPTFCGPDIGIGDELVPDDYPYWHFACCCFPHDLDFATGPRTLEFFHGANMRLKRNMQAMVIATSRGIENFFKRVAIREAGFAVADAYYEAVEIGFDTFFNPDPPGNPFEQHTVIEKLKRAGIRNPYLESVKEK